MRERSRSPAERRDGGSSYSREPRDSSSRESRDSYSRRDYGYSRSSYDRDREYGSGGRSSYGSRGSRGGRGGYGRGSYGGRGRGGYRDRDYSSRRDFNSTTAGSDESYRAKTERNFDNSIFIGNIPFDCTSSEIEGIFDGQFKIIRADIVTNRGRSRGMATVEFASKDDVRAAIEKYDHYDFRGRQIFVRQDYPPPDKKEEASFRSRQDDYRSDYPPRRDEYREKRREAPAPPKPGTEIFVGNLPFSVNWQALKDIMREAGEVVRADVRLDSWGKSRGFGTVVFTTTEAASKAIEMFQGYEIEGRKLDTRPGKTGLREDRGATDSYRKEAAPAKKNSDFTQGVEGNGEPSDTIYVTNLPFVTNNEDLYELFETVGRVAQAEIQYTEKGKPSGNAVVKFELAELSASAIQTLDNYVYGGRNLAITYAKRANGAAVVSEGDAAVSEGDADIDVEVPEASEATEAVSEASPQPESTEPAAEAPDADIEVDIDAAEPASSG